MNQNELTKFSKNDVIASLVIGEICAWLIIAIIQSLSFKVPALYALPVYFPVLCAAGLYIGYLIGRIIPVIYQVAKFVLVGGFNTLVDWGVLALLIFLSRQYLFIEAQDIIWKTALFSIVFYSLFKAVSFVVASVNSYFWNKFWTFKRKTTESMGKEFLQFFTITLIGFVINVVIASVIFNYIGPFGGLNFDQWAIIAAVVATAFSMVWNFAGYKFIVFDESSKQLTTNS
jgi:putative flippase GtrA